MNGGTCRKPMRKCGERSGRFQWRPDYAASDGRRRILTYLLIIVAWPSLALAQTAKLKVAYPNTVGSMAVLWITKEARLFEKHGLEVELIYVAGSSKVVQAMLAKEIPLAEIAIPAVIQANLAGADLVMLAGPNHKPGQKIMVKPEIKKPEDLKGKKIGVTRFGTSDDFLLRYILG
jgi:NitT/TauT family transport system substrate-binding protein